MDDALKNLMVLLEAKITNPQCVPDAVKKQLSILDDVVKREEMEKRIYADFIENIRESENYLQFNYSKKEFERLAKKQKVEGEAAKALSPEIDSVFVAVHKLKDILENQQRTGKFVFYDERQMYLKIDEKLDKIGKMEKAIQNYFADLKELSREINYLHKKN